MRSLAGIDIGGTKIGWCLGNGDGEVLVGGRIPNDGAAPAVLLERALGEICAAGEPGAMGVSCPGPFLLRERRFLDVPNMRAWQGFDLGAWLDEHAGLPTAAMNDANALVAAEALWGAARGASVAVFLTMSTGMGAGIAVDGIPIQGKRGFCGEIGHLRLERDGPVGFGKRGSVEGYLSGPGMAQVAAAEARRCGQLGIETTLTGSVTPEQLFAAARCGDPAALAATEIIGARLGQLLALLVDLLDPEVVALGTIGVEHHDLLLPHAMPVLEREALGSSLEGLRVVPSALVDHGHQASLAVATRAARA